MQQNGDYESEDGSDQDAGCLVLILVLIAIGAVTFASWYLSLWFNGRM